MADFYGMVRLEKPDDWLPVVEKKNWVPGRSAYELAHKWQMARGFPDRVRAVLGTSSDPLLSGLTPELCVVEYPFFLDTRKAPSRNDIMVYSRNSREDPVVIAVEGKTDEPFASRIVDWSRGQKDGQEPKGAPKDTRLRRLEYLCGVLRLSVDPDSPLRYQLFHRTASAVLEAIKLGAAAAMLLVHSFDEGKENWDDYARFIQAVGLSAPEKDRVQGPTSLGPPGKLEVPTFFTWVSDSPGEASSRATRR